MIHKPWADGVILAFALVVFAASSFDDDVAQGGEPEALRRTAEQLTECAAWYTVLTATYKNDEAFYASREHKWARARKKFLTTATTIAGAISHSDPEEVADARVAAHAEYVQKIAEHIRGEHDAGQPPFGSGSRSYAALAECKRLWDSVVAPFLKPPEK